MDGSFDGEAIVVDNESTVVLAERSLDRGGSTHSRGANPWRIMVAIS